MAHTTDELEGMTVDELRDLASEQEVSGRSSMDKAELVAALASDGTEGGVEDDPRGETRIEVMAAMGERGEVGRAREGLPSERIMPPDEDDAVRLRSGREVPGIGEAMAEARDEAVEAGQPRTGFTTDDEATTLRSGRPVPGIDPALEEAREAAREAAQAARPRTLADTSGPRGRGQEG